MDKNLETGSINTIFSAVRSAKDKWEKIGTGLGLSTTTLEQIKDERQGRADQCLYAVINAWLHGRDRARTKGVSWRSLVRILQSPEVSEGGLADKVLSERGFKPLARTQIEKPKPVHVQPQVEKTTGGVCTRGTEGTPLTEIDLKLILKAIECVAFRWYTIGIFLGFLDGELKTIESMPLLIPGGPCSFLREMLSQWLKWAPPKHKQPTTENLADALRNVGEEKVAQSLILELSLTKVDTSRGNLLKSYLKSWYRRETYHSETEWPPTHDVEYVNLVLVHQDKIPHSFQKMVELTKAGQIQTILDHDEFQKLTLADITSYSAHRKVIIIEGAPGVGKTTLAHKLCHDWALDQLLEEFSLVLYIPLRVPLVRVAESVDDLLKYFGDNCTHSDIQCIKESLGNKLLFVLDGWDELRPSCRDADMFFPKLIRGEFLPECNILVTSRPGTTAGIRRHANRLIEILGFTEDQVNQYIHSYFKLETYQGKNVAVKLIEDLEQYPNVSSTCYIAINLTIVCYVYLVSGFELPSTLSEVYEEFIFHAIKRHFSRLQEGETDPKLSNVKAIDDFDCNVKETVRNLGKLALLGLQENELSFSRDKLKEMCHIDESEAPFDGFGLLKLLHVFRRRGAETFYHFLHLTVQEYLAAYSISQMGEEKQGQILASGLRDPRYEMVLKFFCGIDKFKSRQARIIFSQPNHLVVPFVLECIFEGQWEQGCQKVAKYTSSSFSIRRDIQPYRSLVIGYVMAKSGTPWQLTWSNCNIGSHQLKGMSQYVLTVPTTLRCLRVLKAFLTTESMECLAEIVLSQALLSELILSDSHLNDDAVNTLCKTLYDHKRLNVLKLTNDDLTSNSATTVCNLASQLPALQCLDLSGNPLNETTCMDILLIAFTSTSLRQLHLPCACEDLTKECNALNVTRNERGLHELKLIIPQHTE